MKTDVFLITAILSTALVVGLAASYAGESMKAATVKADSDRAID
jgi:hypothetical protein